jgi:hypothetical protein
LISLKILRGILHLHTIFSDGVNTLEEMGEAARVHDDPGASHRAAAPAASRLRSRYQSSPECLREARRCRLDQRQSVPAGARLALHR